MGVWVRRPTVNHGCLYTSIHPGLLGCQTSVECVNYKAESWRLFTVTPFGFCSVFTVESKRRNYVQTSNFSLHELFKSRDKSTPCSLIQFCRRFYPVFNCLLTLHWLVPALPWTGQKPPQVGGLIYYNLQFVTRFSNVENCKMNPENPPV